jgi:hypothetical protein
MATFVTFPGLQFPDVPGLDADAPPIPVWDGAPPCWGVMLRPVAEIALRHTRRAFQVVPMGHRSCVGQALAHAWGPDPALGGQPFRAAVARLQQLVTTTILAAARQDQPEALDWARLQIPDAEGVLVEVRDARSPSRLADGDSDDAVTKAAAAARAWARQVQSTAWSAERMATVRRTVELWPQFTAVDERLDLRLRVPEAETTVGVFVYPPRFGWADAAAMKAAVVAAAMSEVYAALLAHRHGVPLGPDWFLRAVQVMRAEPVPGEDRVRLAQYVERITQSFSADDVLVHRVTMEAVDRAFRGAP